MAVFNPDPKVAAPPQTIGYSQGIGRSTAFAHLFDGLTNAASGYIKAKDEQNQTNLRKDVREGVEAIQEPYIRAVTGDVDSRLLGDDVNAGKDVPQGVRSAEGKLAALQQGFESGQFSENYYYIQLQKLSQSTRAKYPGYEDYIDAAFSSIAGVDPRKAIVGAYFDAISAAETARGKTASDREDFITNNRDVIALVNPDALMNPDAYISDPAKFNKLRFDVGKYESTAVELANRELIDNADTRTYEKLAQDRVNFVTQTFAAGVLNSVNDKTPGASDFMTRLDRATKNPAAAPVEEIQSLLSQGAAIRQKLLEELTYELQTRQLDNEKTYAQVLSPEKIKSLIDGAMAPIDRMLDNLNNENYGAVGYDARTVEAQTNRDTRLFMEKDPLIRQLRVLRENFGEGAVEFALNRSSTLANAYERMVSDTAWLSAVVGAGSYDDAIAMNERMPGPNGEDRSPEQIGAVALDLANRFYDTVMDPNADPKVLQGVLTSMYSSKNANFLNRFDNPEVMFGKLVSPEITKRMQVIGETNPQAWQEYNRWATNNFVNLFGQSLADLQSGIETKYLTGKWNSKTHQFELNFEGQTKEEDLYFRPGDINPQNAWDAAQAQRAQRALNPLNSAVASIVGLAEANGTDPDQAVLKLLTTMGFNPDAPNKDPLLFTIGKAILNELKKASDTLPEPWNVQKERLDLGTGSRDQTKQPLWEENMRGVPWPPTRIDQEPLEKQSSLQPDEIENTVNSLVEISAMAQEIDPDAPGTPEEAIQSMVAAVAEDSNMITPSEQPLSYFATGEGSLAKTPVSLASSFLGQHEDVDAGALSAFFKKAAGINLNPAKTAWCAAFANAVLEASGFKGSEGNRLAARSFEKYGDDVTKNPTKGDIAVFWRGSPNGWQGHVGFYMGSVKQNGKTYIKVLGGNQGDAVSISLYPASRLLSIRRPTEMI